MNNLNNKFVFKESGCISSEVLLRYRDNKLSGVEQHSVEEHLVDCVLCNEALEGLALVSDTSVLDSLKRDITTMLNPAPIKSIRPWLAAATLAGVILFSFFTYTQFKNMNSDKLAVTEMVADSNKSQPVYNEAAGNTITENIPESEKLSLQTQQSQPAQKIITGKRVATDEAESINQKEDIEEAVSNKVASGFEIPPVETKAIPPASAALENALQQNITYVDNLKVIDYSLANSSGAIQADLPRGTSSRYQNKKNQTEAASSEQKSGDAVLRKTDYLELVADPVILFNKGRYESAVTGFDELLQLNNNDQNAIFYKGVSLFHLKNYTSSLLLLVPISRDNYSPFLEEAKFYAARSYIGNSEIPKARIILEELAAGKGFYSERSKEILNSLK